MVLVLGTEAALERSTYMRKLGIVCKNLEHFEELKKKYFWLLTTAEVVPILDDKEYKGIEITTCWIDELLDD